MPRVVSPVPPYRSMSARGSLSTDRANLALRFMSAPLEKRTFEAADVAATLMSKRPVQASHIRQILMTRRFRNRIARRQAALACLENAPK